MNHTRPRLRLLEAFPTELQGEAVVCLRDPSGLSDRIAFLPRVAVGLVALCDGTRTTDDIVDEFARRTGARISAAQVSRLVEQLDEGMFLDSPRFQAHRAAMLEEFRSAPHRPASHAGGSYPVEGAALARILDGLLAEVQDDPLPATRNHDAPVGLIAPHIDFPRGGAVYARGYRALAAAGRPDLVVVFGTDHNGADQPFTLTRKSYATPLGIVETDADLVDALARATAQAPGLDLFADEFHHRNEHSIEFQAVWLRHVFGDRVPPVLPVLCGSLHQFVGGPETPARDPRVTAFLGALRKLTAGRRVLVVAGADLAHVGPRFGDAPMTAADRARVEQADRASLGACAAGDADGFFGFVSAERDERRICGLSPIYASLAFLAGRAAPGDLFGYAQCDADERGESFVSIAAMLL